MSGRQNAKCSNSSRCSAARKRGLGNEPAPGRIARIERRHAGQVLLAHGRADAVGADQQVALLGRPVGEMCHDAAGLFDAAQFLSAMIVRLRQRRVEQMKHAVPCRHGLRDRHAMRHAPVARKHQPQRHLDAEVAVRIEAERAQRGLQLGLRHDAGAAPGKLLGGALVDRNVPAAAPERERGEHAAHRSADHQRAHDVSRLFPEPQNLL